MWDGLVGEVLSSRDVQLFQDVFCQQILNISVVVADIFIIGGGAFVKSEENFSPVQCRVIRFTFV